MVKNPKRNRKFLLFLLFLFLYPSSGLFSQVLLQEDFTNYDGTASTLPTGWYFSAHNNYTSLPYSGNSGPNSFKFALDEATIITPQFNNADSVFFWIKGAGIDVLSNLDVLESSDSSIWTSIANLDALNTTSSSGTTWGFAVQPTSHFLKFSYSKSVGNLAFDDFKLIRSQQQNTTIYPSDTAIAGGKIKIYFNQAVDTTVSSGVNALNIGSSILDTLVAYINRAKYSVDISEYNYLYPSMEKIANAVNNAYSRGVDVRWIYNEGGSNTGLAYLNDNIQTLGRTFPDGLMHNKFVIIDAKSSTAKDAFVYTGSINWGWIHMNEDINNLVIFQDSLLADAYTKEFNQMWGDPGLIPNIGLSKFGAQKTSVITDHHFNIGGVDVELYFSPADPTNLSIKNSISSADTDIYFGVFSFTRQDIANTIKDKIQSGVFSAGIMGNGSTPYNAYSILNPIMNNNLKINPGNPIYHNKIGIIDPTDSISDPQVITGSYNWSTSAENKNDENTVIIHSPIAANMYYQSFYHDFNTLGGALSLTEKDNALFKSNIYPNPFLKECTIQFILDHPTRLTIKAYELNSRETVELKTDHFFNEGIHTLTFLPKESGMYLIIFQDDTQTYIQKVIKTNK